MSRSINEPISVRTSQYGAPGRFFWQGKSYYIDAIDRIWRSTQGKRRGTRVYKVRSGNRSFILRYDLRLKRWFLVRASWRTRLGRSLERFAARVIA